MADNSRGTTSVSPSCDGQHASCLFAEPSVVATTLRPSLNLTSTPTLNLTTPSLNLTLALIYTQVRPCALY